MLVNLEDICDGWPVLDSVVFWIWHLLLLAFLGISKRSGCHGYKFSWQTRQGIRQFIDRNISRDWQNAVSVEGCE